MVVKEWRWKYGDGRVEIRVEHGRKGGGLSSKEVAAGDIQWRSGTTNWN